MKKGFCSDCACLVEGDNGEWICDERDQPIEDVEECPEASSDKDKVYEIYSVVSDILYEAESGKMTWKEALSQLRCELEGEE